METAKQQVDDEDLRELMKENGIDVHPREPILLKPFQTPIYRKKQKNRFYQRLLIQLIDTTKMKW
jgi:hypothetical protein